MSAQHSAVPVLRTPLWVTSEITHLEYELEIHWSPISDASRAGLHDAEVEIHMVLYRRRVYSLDPSALNEWQEMTHEVQEFCGVTPTNTKLTDRLLRKIESSHDA